MVVASLPWGRPQPMPKARPIWPASRPLGPYGVGCCVGRLQPYACRLQPYVAGSSPCQKQAGFGQLALRRLLSAPDHASGCPARRHASAHQPRGQQRIPHAATLCVQSATLSSRQQRIPHAAYLPQMLSSLALQLPGVRHRGLEPRLADPRQNPRLADPRQNPRLADPRQDPRLADPRQATFVLPPVEEGCTSGPCGPRWRLPLWLRALWAQWEAAVRPRGEAKVAGSTARTLPLPTHQVLLSADPATEILARSGLIPSASAAVISGKEGGVRCHLTVARAPAASATAAAAAAATAATASTTSTAVTTAVTAEPTATAAPPPVTPLEGGGLKGADAAAAEGRRRPPRAEEEVEVQCRVGEGSEGGGSRRWLRARVTRAAAVGGADGDGDSGGGGGGEGG
eukprot:scaffold743_cov47-Phaeocystis_antarctica.AAC.2